MRKYIEKKILPEYYRAVYSGEKTFEIRKDEDDIQVDDVVFLLEYDGKEYTGYAIKANVTYVLRNCPEYGLMDTVFLESNHIIRDIISEEKG